MGFKPSKPSIQPVKTNSSDSLFLTPSTHVPGTFPMSIRNNNSSGSSSSSSRHVSSSSSSSSSEAPSNLLVQQQKKKSLTRPVSVYDNLMNDSAVHNDLINLLKAQDDFQKSSRSKVRGDSDSSGGDVLWDYDQIVDVSNSLQNMIENWEVDLGVGEEDGKQRQVYPKNGFKAQLPSYRKISEVSLFLILLFIGS